VTVPCTLPRSSLQIGPFDLLDPDCDVVLAAGWDRGAPVPTQSQIQASVLDGASVVGDGAGNRSPSLPVNVHGATRLQVAEMVNQLIDLVGATTWEMTWTPGGGFPVVIECFRATVTVTSGIRQEEQGLTQSLTITCSALPYGRSPDPVTVALAGSPLLIDAFDSAPVPTATATTGTVGTPTNVVSPTPAQGTRQLQVPFTPATGQDVRDHVSTSIDYTLSRTGLSRSVAGEMGSVRVTLTQNGTARGWMITIVITCSDGSTHTAAGMINLSTVASALSLTFDTPIADGATITGYSIRSYAAVSGSSWSPGGSTGPTDMYFDALTVYPDASNGISDPQGVTVHLNGVQGSARTPIGLALSQAAGAPFSSWCVHAAPADGGLAQPLIPLGGTATPDTYYTSGQVRYRGVYDVWVVAAAVAGSGARTWTLTVSQEDIQLGNHNVAATVTPQANQLVYLGSIVLPVVDYPDETSSVTHFTMTSSNSGDAFNDLLLLDTRGQTVMVDGNAPASKYVFIDPPDPDVALGGIYTGNHADKTVAASITANVIRAGVLFANPGDTTLLLYSPTGVLQGTATYYPRWQQDATS
jgi:hypothetical protein